jgi:hypothetical protein
LAPALLIALRNRPNLRKIADALRPFEDIPSLLLSFRRRLAF